MMVRTCPPRLRTRSWLQIYELFWERPRKVVKKYWTRLFFPESQGNGLSQRDTDYLPTGRFGRDDLAGTDKEQAEDHGKEYGEIDAQRLDSHGAQHDLEMDG